MIKTDFTQQGGFPLEEKTLDYTQKAYLQILQAFIGHLDLPNPGNFIISGCELSVVGISAGMMYIDGELCPFEGIGGGTATTKIGKIETVEEAPFESGDNFDTYFIYTAGELLTGVPYEDFERVPNVPEMVNQVVNWADVQGIPAVVIDPANLQATPPELTVLQRLELLEAKNAVFQSGGGMVLWNKPANQIPAGWAEVVDWRGRMPVGVDPTILNGNFVNPEFSPQTTGQNDPGRTGGLKNQTLDLENIPRFTIDGLPGTEIKSNGGPEYLSGYNKDRNLTIGGKPDGTTKAFSVLNPYRTVLFIEWVGLP